ncbi:MAG: carbohydrate-binding family 9-like protein, partial [Deltaproteobacteria bacterium]|nr:carbohydrate-binding family 9-like protein [Deltaproteobacteria bacterium]
DNDVASQYANQDDPLWKEDTFEVFIDADGNRRGYVELQVNPRNAHFDTWWPTNRGNPDDKSYTAGIVSAVNVRGSLDDRDDDDQGWDAEIAIPWAAVKGKDDAMKVTLPPVPGSTWRMNVVRVDKGKAEAIAAASWSKITYSDFHALDRMLTVVFADAQGSTTPPPAPVAPVGVPGDGGVPGDAGVARDGGAVGPGDAGAGDAGAPAKPALRTMTPTRPPARPIAPAPTP